MAQIILTDKPLDSASQLLPTLRFAGVALAATALIAICAHVSLPLFFTPVPLTLQDFAVLLIGLLLSPVAAFATLALYLLEGAAGLPVFAPQGPVGVLHLLGPTGGYLMSYILAAPLISWLRSRGSLTYLRAACSAAAGSALILALGALWLATGAAWVAALPPIRTQTLLMHAVLPFLPGSALKVMAAAGVAMGIQSARAREDALHPRID